MADLTYLLEPTLYHTLPKTNIANINFVIVGAGGTGGYLIPQLVRQVSLTNASRRSEGKMAHTITIYDADDIELKNLQRQNFVSQDVGKNKAEVMANRYGRSFQEEVRYVPEYVTEPASFVDQIIGGMQRSASVGSQSVTLIDCTDNNKTRLLMREAANMLQKSTNVVFLSSGNEEKAGQVVCSFKPSEEQKHTKKLASVNWSKLKDLRVDTDAIDTPDFFDIFPNFELDKMPGEMSCAEAAVSAPQNIYTNMTAANILFGFVNKLLSGAGISELMVFFDTDSFAQKIYRSKISDMKNMLNLMQNNGSFVKFIGVHESFEMQTTGDLLVAMTWQEALVIAEESKKLKKMEIEELAASLLSQ